MTHHDYRTTFMNNNRQAPIYRPAIFRHVGVIVPMHNDAKFVIVLDLPAHRGSPASKLHIPIDAKLPHATYSCAQNGYSPGTISLGLPRQLQQAPQSAGISLDIRDAQALLYDLYRVRRWVPGCAA